MDEAYYMVGTTARVYRDGEPIKWCEAHHQAARPTAPTCIMVAYLEAVRASVADPCRIVSKVIVGTEEGYEMGDDMNVVRIDPSLFAELAEMHELLQPLMDNASSGDLYLEGSLQVRSKNDFIVGRFVMDADFWVFEMDLFPHRGKTR